MSTAPSHLFITGTSRSGTTTMADFLRLDQRIVMGRERYAFQLEKLDAFTPDLFEKERFCNDFRQEDSHHTTHQPYYAEAHQYFDSASIVGDKIPNMFEHYQKVLTTFPDSKIIYMARNPYEIADSFQKRADKTKMQISMGMPAANLWPQERDWQAAIRECNQSIEQTQKHYCPDKFFVVNYSDLYYSAVLLDELYQFLGLELNAAIKRNWQLFAEKRKKIELMRQIDLTELQRSMIAASLNWQGFSNLTTGCR